MPAADGAAGAAGARLAAATSLGLGLLAGAMMVAGHQPWDGPQVASFTQTHGLHLGDVLAVGPVLVGVALSRWCWGARRLPARATASWGPAADR